MSDERRDNEDGKDPEASEGSEETFDNSKKSPESGDESTSESTSDKEADPSGETHDADDETRKQEEFDDYFGDGTDPYEDDDDYYYNEHEDYGFDEPKGPKKPKSAAGRMLSRQRTKESAVQEDAGTEDEDSEDDEEGGMSFLEHLEEFRWTIARSVLAFIVGVVVVVIFHQNIAQWMQLPLHRAYGSAEVAQQNLITYKAMGVISVFFQIALLGGLTLSMPFMLYFMGSFVAPGLTDKERLVLRPACYIAFLLFLIGVAFAFFIILPLALGFTVRLNQHLGFDIFWAASDYYNMVVWFSLSIGIFFQFPLIVVILVYIGVLATETLRGARKMVFVGLMVFSALVSPGGDPVSLSVTTGFMYGLYELAILTGARIERKKRELEEAIANTDISG